ncbi:MAG: HU family DNA-binding protein [Anaerolinea sp.]|nr:HU family DNA-binding protein [Anaerolinea sp.]
MTLNRKATIRAIGRRTGLKQRDVQLMLETLIEVWTEELVSGGRVELEHFLVMEVQAVERPANRLLPKQRFRKITIRAGKALRRRFNDTT